MKLEQELIEYQKLGGHPISGRKTSTPTKSKAPSFMKRPQPTQGKKAATPGKSGKAKRRKIAVANAEMAPHTDELGYREEGNQKNNGLEGTSGDYEVNLDDELSLDTIKEIDTNQE